MMAVAATLAGFAGSWLVTTGTFPAVQAWALGMPLDKQAAFMADLFAHVCRYAVGALAAAWKRYA